MTTRRRKSKARTGKSSSVWQRHPREQTVDASLGAGGGAPWVVPLPDSGGLELNIVERAVSVVDLEGQIPAGTRSISLFLVNHRPPLEARLDEAFVFQPQLDVRCEVPFVPRPDLRGASPEDWDEQVADLHYADVPAYATGHSVSAEWETADGACRLLRTAWIPSAEVEKTSTVELPGVELSMNVLGVLEGGPAVEKALAPLVERYRTWIEERRDETAQLAGTRRDTADQLLSFASFAADRIERGIAVLARGPRRRSTRFGSRTGPWPAPCRSVATSNRCSGGPSNSLSCCSTCLAWPTQATPIATQ